MQVIIGLIQTILLIMGIIMFWNISPWWSIANLVILIFTFGWAVGKALGEKK